MNRRQQMLGRCRRLERELDEARRAAAPDSVLLARLRDDIASTKREIDTLPGADAPRSRPGADLPRRADAPPAGGRQDTAVA